jgi:hypothetical protein
MKISYARCLPVIAGMLSLCHPAAAQQPSPPTLPPPPSRAAWEVSYKKNAPPRKPSKKDQAELVPQNVPAEIKSRDYTVNGELGRAVTRYSDGKSVTMYAIDQLVAFENPQDTNDIVIASFSALWIAQEEFRKQYPGLDWVVPSLYKGKVEINGTSYHYFAEEEAAPAAPAPGAATSETPTAPQPISPTGRQAWFGMDGRPASYKDRIGTATFTFKSADEIPSIEVPQRFRAVIQRYMDSLAPTTLK